MSRKSKGFDVFAWSLFLGVVATWFVIYFFIGFVQNCIWTWPPRFDVGQCWNEQVDPAQQKALEKGEPLFRGFKVKHP